jgi:hypothetical protein
MMPIWIAFDPGNRSLDFMLVVALGFVLTSCVACARNKTTKSRRGVASAAIVSFLTFAMMASTTRFMAAPAAAGQPRSASINAVPRSEPTSQNPDPDDPKLAGHFSGRVFGPDGKPLSRARVYIIPYYSRSNTPGPVRAETDAQGRFEFDAPDMTYTGLDGLPARRTGLLIATADGFAPDWMETWGQTRSGIRSHWDPVKGAAVNLQLARDDVPIRGRLLGPDGRPLTGARVRLTGLTVPLEHDLDAHLRRLNPFGGGDIGRTNYRPQRLPGLTTETQTDADGRFTLSGLGRDRLAELDVSQPSVVDTTLTVMTRNAPDVGTRGGLNGGTTWGVYGAGFTLQLQRGLTVTGQVRDRDTHAPIPGMWVGPYNDPWEGLSAGTYRFITDADGHFALTGLPTLPPGRAFKIQVTAVSPPGLSYQAATEEIHTNTNVVIECRRAIPFRLKVVDEQARPVEAEVTSYDIASTMNQPRTHDARWPISRAAHRGAGIYEGFLLPGPGAVLVKTPPQAGYRPAHVDPKAFFAPGRTNWTPQEQNSAYGTQDTLSVPGEWIDQHDYAAIVLVNPPPNSGPLDLSATLVHDRPRRVSLIDPEGKPVVGAQTEGMTFFPWDAEPALRIATFSLRGLSPDRVQRITFFKEDRRLIGFLMARGDGDAPYTVRMQPWGTVIGRISDAHGKPQKADLSMGTWALETNSDPAVGVHFDAATDAQGRFRIDKLVPGQRYSATIWGNFKNLGTAFDNLVVRAGEVRDLGEIRAKNPQDRVTPAAAKGPLRPIASAAERVPAGRCVLEVEAYRTLSPNDCSSPRRFVPTSFSTRRSTSLSRAKSKAGPSIPLGQAIRELNDQYRNDRIGKDQPPLTEDEVVAAILWAAHERKEFPVTDDEFQAFQHIAESRRLPRGSQFEVLTGYEPDTFTVFEVWSVRIRMPRLSGPGSYAFRVRERIIRVHKTDPQMIVWGKPAKGLAVGVLLDARQDKYRIGDVIKPRFFLRNEGTQEISVAIPRLLWLSANDIVAVDATGKTIGIQNGDEQYDIAMPSGRMEQLLTPQGVTEIRIPFSLGVGKVNDDRGVGRIIDAKAGQQCRISFRNVHETMQTGEITFTVGGQPTGQEGPGILPHFLPPFPPTDSP